MSVDTAIALPARARAPSAGLRNLWIAPPLLILIALFFYPFALIVMQALGGDQHVFSLANFERVLHTRQFTNGIYNTIQIAVSASIGCLVLGFSVARGIAVGPWPGARFIG